VHASEVLVNLSGPVEQLRSDDLVVLAQQVERHVAVLLGQVCGCQDGISIGARGLVGLLRQRAKALDLGGPHAVTSLARHSGHFVEPVAAGTWSWKQPGVLQGSNV